MAMEFHAMIKEDEEAALTSEEIGRNNLYSCMTGEKQNLFKEIDSEHHFKKLGGVKSLCGKKFHSDNIDDKVLGELGNYDYVNCPLCLTWMSTPEWQMRVIRENIIRRLLKIIVPLNDWLEKKCKKHKWLNWLLS